MILTAIAIAFFITHFEPLQYAIDKVFDWVVPTFISNMIHASFGCMKCMSFWVGLIVSQSFVTACIASLTAYFIHLCLQLLNRLLSNY